MTPLNVPSVASPKPGSAPVPPSLEPTTGLRVHATGDVSTRVELEALSAAFHQALALTSGERDSRKTAEALRDAVLPMARRVKTPWAWRSVEEEIFPLLAAWFDERLGRRDPVELSVLLEVLELFAIRQWPAGYERISKAARLSLEPQSPKWSAVFAPERDACPGETDLLDSLRNPLPEGFIAVACLDRANALCKRGVLESHPFDTTEGWERLRVYLQDVESEHFTWAQSALASLYFLRNGDPESLLKLALTHKDTRIHMEGALVAAREGKSAGIRLLVQASTDSRTHARARRYLREIGREHEIPAQARQPDFIAEAELCDWLTNEFERGQPPNEVEVVDRREMVWPPTGDRRKLWLLRFLYRGSFPYRASLEGIGLVGSLTHSLPSRETQTLPGMPPLDLYAIYASSELVRRGDPRAPQRPEDWLRVGRQLLESANGRSPAP